MYVHIRILLKCYSTRREMSFVPTCFGHLMKSALCICLRIFDKELSLVVIVTDYVCGV